MPIVQNGKKQKMIYKDGSPISKVYKGTILLFRATDVLSVGGIGTDAFGTGLIGQSNQPQTVETGFAPLGGLGVDMIGQDELGFSFSTHYDADDFISQ